MQYIRLEFTNQNENTDNIMEFTLSTRTGHYIYINILLRKDLPCLIWLRANIGFLSVKGPSLEYLNIESKQLHLYIEYDDFWGTKGHVKRFLFVINFDQHPNIRVEN